MKISRNITLAALFAAGALISACSSSTPAPVAATQAISPQALGKSQIIFSFANATVAETETDIDKTTTRAIRPDEYGPGNQLTISAFQKKDGCVSLAKYIKTGPNTATIRMIDVGQPTADMAEAYAPMLDLTSYEFLIERLGNGLGDGSTTYELTFTSDTTATATVIECGGTFENTITGVTATLVRPADESTQQTPAAAITPPASLNGCWIRLDQTGGMANKTHCWLYCHNGKLYSMNSEHPADTVPAKPKSFKCEAVVIWKDNLGRYYNETDQFSYTPSSNTFYLRYNVNTIRQAFHLSGELRTENGSFIYPPTPVLVTLDKEDAVSVSGTCQGYYGDESGVFEPTRIHRITIFK